MKEDIIMLIICYPKCTTCKGALAFLNEHSLAYEQRDIKQNNPTADELAAWHAMSGLPLQRFFNTSGLLYRAMNLKDKLPQMTETDMLALLATDGMLVRRPLLILEDRVLVGFKRKEWEESLGTNKDE